MMTGCYCFFFVLYMCFVDKKWRKLLWQLLGLRKNLVTIESDNNGRLNINPFIVRPRIRDESESDLFSSHNIELKNITKPIGTPMASEIAS